MCPFIIDDFPVGIFGTCCSLRGKGAARELEALGEQELSNAMFSDMTCDEAIAFAHKLRDGADRLESENGGAATKPRGAGWNGTWDAERKDWAWGKYSTFAEALAEVRDAADWYEKVGALGFGVCAWY